MSREQVLKNRSEQLQKARSFFQKRGLLEIDCPALVRYPPIDSHIDCIQVDQDNGFLHTSPEYVLKRLLAEGVGDCYFLGHVYRKAELGHLHNPEFTMAEWYRIGFTLDQMIQETASFLFLFLGKLPIQIISYLEAFQMYAQVDYRAPDLKIKTGWTRSDQIHYLLTHQIEPKLGQNGLTVITDYPPEEAGLAKLKQTQQGPVAERFEIYYQGVELANGYHELNNPEELRQRFHQNNLKRSLEGKKPYSLDENFLKALPNLPDCCGVALGFDRALMLQYQYRSIKKVLPFAWDEL